MCGLNRQFKRKRALSTPLEIDPRKLLYFATVIEHGSLNRAAKLLRVSQPALSKSMDRLEADLGMQLLERGSKGIIPTRSGNLLYCHARLIREEIQLAERELFNPRCGDSSGPATLRVGTLPSLVSNVMPLALSRWREVHQAGHLEIVELSQGDLLTGLLRRDFDFVIGLTKVFDIIDGLRQRVLFRDTQCVIAGPNHPLRFKEKVKWEDLVAYPWISPTSPRTHSVLENLVIAMKVPLPRQLTVCGPVSLLKSLVAETDHLALLPSHAVFDEIAEQKLFVLPFEDPKMSRDIAVLSRDGYVWNDVSRDLVTSVMEVGLELCRGSRAQN